MPLLSLNLLSATENETLGSWTDGRIPCRHSAATSFLGINYNYYDCVSGKSAVQNGTLSGQTVLDHSSETAVNGPVMSDGEVAAAVIEEDAAVCIRLRLPLFQCSCNYGMVPVSDVRP